MSSFTSQVFYGWKDAKDSSRQNSYKKDIFADQYQAKRKSTNLLIITGINMKGKPTYHVQNKNETIKICNPKLQQYIWDNSLLQQYSRLVQKNI